ncbi:12257_t:CDS:1 [Funneliformis geosporum]|nr:12257_t:CDS:1 [Funneliformis geosporum]
MSGSYNSSSLEEASQTSRSSIRSDAETNSTNTTDQSKKRRREGPGGSNKKSFIWKYFVEKDNPNGPGTITACTLNLRNGQPCSTSYASFGSTSNAITHLANVHGIVEQGKLHIKVK